MNIASENIWFVSTARSVGHTSHPYEKPFFLVNILKVPPDEHTRFLGINNIRDHSRPLEDKDPQASVRGSLLMFFFVSFSALRPSHTRDTHVLFLGAGSLTFHALFLFRDMNLQRHVCRNLHSAYTNRLYKIKPFRPRGTESLVRVAQTRGIEKTNCPIFKVYGMRPRG